MNGLVDQLRQIEQDLDLAACDAFTNDEIPSLPEADIAEVLAVTGRIQRRIEGVQIEATAQVHERSEGMRDDKMTLAFGCSCPADLVRMLLGSDARRGSQLAKAATFVRRERSLTEGGFLPARYQSLREVLVAGDLGLAGLLASVGPIERSCRRVSAEDRIQADQQLADLARGLEYDAEQGAVPRPLPSPEDLALFAEVVVAYLDPDGAEPTDEVAMRGRSFSIGRLNAEGRVPARGELLPEIAAQLEQLIDSLLNPRVDGPDDLAQPGVRFESSDDRGASPGAPADTRTRGQKVHDALAAIVNTAVRTDLFPQLGGAAPTLVVQTDAEDFVRGQGWARIVSNGASVPQRVAAQTGCAGGIQRVLFDDNGRIASLGTSARIFNAIQRRAITLRDGGCVIPGCTTPASWCEIHHVREHADGGPTHTDNGVLLCWWHHRNLHETEWTIRMNRGIPEVRGPAWWDPHQRWHRARSPHRRQTVLV